MSLEKFLDAISRVMPAGGPPGARGAIAALDPDKIYLENVRSILGVSYQHAFDICEAAVRQGVFEGGVEVLCPDGVVAASANSESGLPEMVRCWHRTDGELEEVEIPVRALRVVRFYRLK